MNYFTLISAILVASTTFAAAIDCNKLSTAVEDARKVYFSDKKAATFLKSVAKKARDAQGYIEWMKAAVTDQLHLEAASPIDIVVKSAHEAIDGKDVELAQDQKDLINELDAVFKGKDSDAKNKAFEAILKPLKEWVTKSLSVAMDSNTVKVMSAAAGGKFEGVDIFDVNIYPIELTEAGTKRLIPLFEFWQSFGSLSRLLSGDHYERLKSLDHPFTKLIVGLNKKLIIAAEEKKDTLDGKVKENIKKINTEVQAMLTKMTSVQNWRWSNLFAKEKNVKPQLEKIKSVAAELKTMSEKAISSNAAVGASVTGNSGETEQSGYSYWTIGVIALVVIAVGGAVFYFMRIRNANEDQF